MEQGRKGWNQAWGKFCIFALEFMVLRFDFEGGGGKIRVEKDTTYIHMYEHRE